MPREVVCSVCKKKFKDKRGGRKKFCTQKCYWDRMREVLRSEFSDSDYKSVTINGRRTREHRYLMEKSVGRKLLKDEVVHHKNGNKKDNRIENLEIISQSEHIKLHFNIKKF